MKNTERDSSVPDEIYEMNKIMMEGYKEQYNDFSTNFKKGICYICNLPLIKFDISKPCVHWLLRPEGFDKRHFKFVYERFMFVEIDAYLRWVANEENPITNINDLSSESRDDMIIDTTIKYKNLEWTLSCAKSDIEGHKTRQQGKEPHYHFQMRIDDKPFIDFSEEHIPLTEHDLEMIKIMNNEDKKVKHIHGFGAGMESFFSEIPSENALDLLRKPDEQKKEKFHLSTIIEATDEPIPYEKIEKWIKESESKKILLAKILSNVKGVKTSTIITPGEDLHKKTSRKKSRQK